MVEAAPVMTPEVGDHTLLYLLWDEPLDPQELEERIAREFHLSLPEVMEALSRCTGKGFVENRRELFRLTPKGRAARFAMVSKPNEVFLCKENGPSGKSGI